MSRTVIIAEAGVNHNGSLCLAKQLVDVAAECGADYVKFQTFKAERLVNETAVKADYQKENQPDRLNESQLEMLKRLELSAADHYDLLDHCKLNNIRFLSTAFDVESIDLLKGLGINLGKIPSGEITNLPYLEQMARNFEQIVMSTGMADEDEVRDALNILLNAGLDKDQITVLHCNTEYPTPMMDVNLRAMQTIRETFHVSVGYSDHTLGIEVPVAAVALGASVIEKHFTLDKKMDGPDHRASLEPGELRAMIVSIRNVEAALGNGVKRPSTSEKKNIAIARRSIYAALPIKAGDIFTNTNLTTKRPGNGMSPMRWYDLIGHTSAKDYEIGEPIIL